ncbi:DUF1414 domain-containing protein [Agaribacter marinus]|uniref:UPF0352 protein n=1 Tax=Agaribacter marinus TaxID=1431249 RepID=A0AA37T2C2_9ALTE|nr:DUF1414 domain-containing protein [Agaribacter marinus]GLR70345.1 UPF0352 protein [Agaribacter marinus]
MPIQSRYTNEEFERLMQEVFITLERNEADRDLSLMALGNVIATIFTQQVNENDRDAMVEKFCQVLKKSASSK